MIKAIIPPTRLQKHELGALKYIDHTCHNIPRDTISRNHVIQFRIFDSGTPEE